MRHVGSFALLSIFALSCATGGDAVRPNTPDPVDQALTAMGGANQLGAISSMTIKATARHWEPEQSVKADGEPRLASDSTLTIARLFVTDSARIDWVRKMAYPAPREYKFSEVVTPIAGMVVGADSTALPKAATQSDPPRHFMSGVRLATAQRELTRSSPRLLIDMKDNPGKVHRAGNITVDGKSMPAVRYETGQGTFTVLFDPATNLPSRIRTLDVDNVYGDSTYDLVLTDWRDVGGVKVAHQQSYQLNGHEVIHVQVDDVQMNSIDSSQLALPPEAIAKAPKTPKGDVPYQWVIRRQFIGTYLDSDKILYDPAATDGLRLDDLGPGVSQVVGGSHNSLVVEMKDHLVVFDAPVGELQSRFTLDAIAKRYPGKPVKYLVLSHHHMDHIGGARTFVAAGAAVIVPAGDKAHFEKMFVAPHTLDHDALDKNPRRAEVTEVADSKTLTDGKRTVEILRFDNPHVDGMLLGYVPDAKIGFVVDVWSPGRDKLGDKITPAQATVVAAVKRLSSTPERLAGGHGSVAAYAPLAALSAASAR